MNIKILPGPCPFPVVTLEDTVTCWGCGKEIPEAEARPYWLRTKRNGWEWERQEYCEPCTHKLPADAQPELDF